MISLTYLSTATSPFSVTDLAALLDSARETNRAVGLTGMLLYAGGHFIQTLEGPIDVVDATFARIERDPRHRDLLVALREGIEERTFPDWSMGFEDISPEQASELPGFSEYLDHKTLSGRTGPDLGRPGVFHRLFRDRMR